MGGKSWSPQDGPKKPAAVQKPELVRNPAPAKPADDHLPMVPLSGDKTGTYETGKPGGSATSFFAIPGSNKRDDGGPPKAAGPVVSGPTAGAAPAGPVVAGPVPVGPIAVGGPTPAGGISGPVAGAGMAAAPGMGMPGAGYDPHAIQEQRSASNRVFAVVALLVMVVCFALVVAVGLLVFAFVQSQQEEQLEIPTERPSVAIDRPPVDTGLNVEKSKPKPEPRVGRPPPRKPRNGGTSPKPVAPKPPPEPTGPAAGTVTVTKPSDQFYTQVEVRCGAGFRVRADFKGNTATVADVPAESCLMTFKGGAASPKVKFTGARSFRCTGSGAAMMCN